MNLWIDLLQLACFLSAATPTKISEAPKPTPPLKGPACQKTTPAFYIHTKKQPKGLEFNSVNASADFVHDKNTKIITHGYNASKDDVQIIVNEYLKLKDVNVLTFDWRCLKGLDEAAAAAAAVTLGKDVVALKINNLYSTYKIKPEQIHLIGHGMGAHLMGAAGRVQEKKIARITGLDPHGKFFSESSKVKLPKLKKTDAVFVDVIHTSSGTNGIKESIGTADFFPNGGEVQPGCENSQQDGCSSHKAVQHYAESVTNSEAFWSRSCPNYKDFQAGKCKNNTVALFGAFGNTTVEGNFYFMTNSEHPHSLGLNGSNHFEIKRRFMKHTHVNKRATDLMVSTPKHGAFFIHTTKHPKGIELDLDTMSPHIVKGGDMKIITHGYKGSKHQVQHIVNAYLSTGYTNVLTYDWSYMAHYSELEAARGAVYLGLNIVSIELTMLYLIYEVKLEQMHLIGYNMGAHLMGAAGRAQGGRVGRITGLDPSIKYFNDSFPPLLPSLRRTDAKFVDIIHTSPGVLGIAHAIGTVDVYFNRGSVQPNYKNENWGVGNSLMAIEFFAESIKKSDAFYGRACRSYEKFVSNQCYDNPTVLVGAFGDLTAQGSFYLVTDDASPYGLRRDGVNPTEKVAGGTGDSVEAVIGAIPNVIFGGRLGANIGGEFGVLRTLSVGGDIRVDSDVKVEFLPTNKFGHEVVQGTDIIMSPSKNGTLYIHTRKHPKGIELDLHTVSPHIIKGGDMKIITHGYKGSKHQVQHIVNAYLSIGYTNVLTYDWSYAAHYSELEAARGAVYLGLNIVSIELTMLYLIYEVKLEQMHLIGYNMGAHLMGAAGRAQGGRVGRITGLDPSIKYFNDSSLPLLPGLRRTDAKFVDIIHTSAGVLGIAHAIGTVDVYFNGGSVQPNCKNKNWGVCNSLMAIEFFAESIKNSDAFYGRACRSYEKFVSNQCYDNPTVLVGAFGDLTAQGSFYLVTDDTSPYGLRRDGVNPIEKESDRFASVGVGQSPTKPVGLIPNQKMVPSAPIIHSVPKLLKNETFLTPLTKLRDRLPFFRQGTDTKVITPQQQRTNLE